MSEVKSNCCNAQVMVDCDIDLAFNSYSYWYVCKKCGEHCDVSPAPSDGAEAAK